MYALILLALLSPQSPLAGHPPVSTYSVRMVTSGEGEAATIRLAVVADKTRIEILHGPDSVTMIERRDRKLVILLLPQEKMFFERPLETVSGASPAKPAEVRSERIGTEAIDGEPCEKWKFTSGGHEALAWVSQKTGLPYRMTDESHRIDWKDYAFGPQPAVLFEVPPDYRKLEIPDFSAMAGQMALGQLQGTVTQQLGIQLGSAIGGAIGGPLGMVLGQYLGQAVAGMIVSKASKALVPSPH